MPEAVKSPAHLDVASRLAQLVAANVNTVMSEAIRDPVIRSSIVATLESRPTETLSTDERIWLDWCKGFA